MRIQEAKSLLTKFFYNANHLNFQILIQTESGIELHGEYNDYKLYKTAFDQIHQNLNIGRRLKSLSEKKIKIESPFSNVA